MPTPIQSTTQEHLDVFDIVDNLILLKDGSAAMIITTTAVNFGLLSESEQDATIYAYAALLNSLTYPIQILIRSKRKDISAYEKLLEEQELHAINPENKDRIKKYREFIQETVRERNVLDKSFYIVIPFSVLELGITKSATALAKSPHKGLPFPKEYIIQRSKMSLEPKFDHLVHQLSRLGLRARQLTTKELIQLMFEIYNPDSSQGQLLASPEEYETPLVKPAVAFQESPQIEQPGAPRPETTTPLTQPEGKPPPAATPTQRPQPAPEAPAKIKDRPAGPPPTEQKPASSFTQPIPTMNPPLKPPATSAKNQFPGTAPEDQPKEKPPAVNKQQTILESYTVKAPQAPLSPQEAQNSINAAVIEPIRLEADKPLEDNQK